MECIEARALKPSFLSQVAMKANNNNNNNSAQVYYNDDVWCLSAGGDNDFAVEELLNLDFPEKLEFLQDECFSHDDDDDEEASQKESEENNNNPSSNFSDDFDSLSAGELAVPVDDLENLEWLSQFVDDSTSGFTPLFPAASLAGKAAPVPANRFEPAIRPSQIIRAPFFPVPVPRKSRSKRSRSTGRRWSFALSSGDSSPTSSSSYGSSVSPFVLANTVPDMDWFSGEEKPAAKKQRRKSESDGGGSVSGRRCTHCQVQKTPQWRTGPLGPKTLCNACGVRFKSGRLFPEYRPAFSPTFSHEMHSNSHRKVLEIRRKNEVEVVVAVMEPAGLVEGL